MAGRALTYSRVITWLKVLLPLVALALLSTMFLFAQSVAPTSTIPFAELDLEERINDQQITEPFLAGKTASGHDIRVTANTAKPDLENPNLSHVVNVKANIAVDESNMVDLASGSGQINSGALTAEFYDEVQITSSTGYEFQSSTLSLNLDTGTAKSATEVTGSGPAGEFRAGAMELTAGNETTGGRFLFTNGVELLYTPKKR